jgi:hypothetical protein
MPMMVTEMNMTVLRPAPSRFRRRSRQATVESLMEQIALLASDRQRLRETGARPAALERNRIKLARRQWELSHALIERHLSASQSRAA